MTRPKTVDRVSSAVTALRAIEPTSEPRLMDLVASAGVDVSDWKENRRGEKWAAANPKYCYNWAFVQPDGAIVITLWYDRIRVERGKLRVTGNMRRWGTRLPVGGGPKIENWRRRAYAWDAAVRLAAERSTGVRAVVSAGDLRESKDLGGTSKVKRRLLDGVIWAVTKYVASSGEYTLVRGASPARLVDQFETDDDGGGVAERHPVTHEAFRRSERVRRKALIRANGYCDWCGQLGFVTADGGVYLETHHVVPLSEGGADTVTNVAALCATHHREAHHGLDRARMRGVLARRIARRKA
jgi:5-methylcytosine-specific restriction protein A